MVESTNLLLLRNLEAFQAYSEILAFLNQEEAMEDSLKKLRDIFVASFTEYDKVLVYARRSQHTADMVQFDGLRDYKLRSFIAQVKLYLASPDPEEAKAARELLDLLEKYGKNIPVMPYRQETAAIFNFLQDCDLEVNAAYIKALHVEHWIADLRTANEKFDAAMHSRTDVASEAELGAVKAAREKVQTDFEKFCEMLNALSVVNGEAAYKQMCDRINQIVSESHDVIARRQSRKKNNNENPEETTVQE